MHGAWLQHAPGPLVRHLAQSILCQNTAVLPSHLNSVRLCSFLYRLKQNVARNCPLPRQCRPPPAAHGAACRASTFRCQGIFPRAVGCDKRDAALGSGIQVQNRSPSCHRRARRAVPSCQPPPGRGGSAVQAESHLPGLLPCLRKGKHACRCGIQRRSASATHITHTCLPKI